MFKLLIWGTGERSRNYMENNYFEENQIMGFVDSSGKIESFYNYAVLAPEAAYSMMMNVDYIIIATKYYAEIFEKLIENEIPEEKIVLTDCIDEPPYINDMDTIRKISVRLYDRMMLQSSKRMIGINEIDKTDKDRVLGTAGFSEEHYMGDYFRYRSFEFMVKEIQESALEGDVAELGVFRGMFARLINEKFKDSKFFLFDSFEGFREEEVEKEMKLGRCDRMFKDRCKQTAEEMVLRKLTYPEKCTILKGMFPAYSSFIPVW